MTTALWIDPSDDNAVTVENGKVVAATDKSGTGNDVAAGASSGDLVCNFSAQSPNNVFTSQDKNQIPLTFLGDARIEAGPSPMKGDGALFSPGLNSPDSAVEVDDASLVLGTGDFTIETWVYWGSAFQNFNGIYDTRATSGTPGTNLLLYYQTFSGSNLRVSVANTDRITGPTLVTGQWYHVAVCRASGTTRLFVDGAQVGSSYADSNNYANSRAVIGGLVGTGGAGGNSGADVYLSGLRVIVGTALYPNASPQFTPPEPPYEVAPNEDAVIYDTVSPGYRALDFSNGTLLTAKNASPILTNMDGPDLSVMVAHSLPLGLPAASTLISMEGVGTSPPGDGWRMKLDTGEDFVSISVADELTNFVEIKDAPLSSKSFAVTGMVYDATSGMLAGTINGKEVGAVAYTGGLGFGNDLVIGENYPGRIHEVVYYDGALPSHKIQTLEGYLAHKWGYADELPYSHPFRYRGPDKVIDASLVANFDGLSGTASPPGYVAETGQSCSFTGNAVIDDNESKFGTTSLLLDGVGDYVSFPSEAAFDFGTGDFTVEAWLYPTDHTVANIISWGSSTQGAIYFSGSGQKLLFQTGGALRITSTNDIALDEWSHVVIARESGTYRMYINGVEEGTSTPATQTHDQATFEVGRRVGSSNVYAGRVDSVRVVKGRALYTKAFTVTQYRGFRVPEQVTLLANFNAVDGIASPPGYTTEDVNALPVTFGGGAMLDTAQKKFGVSSLYCGASPNAYLDIADTSPELFTIGDNDFTIELWVRFESVGTQQGIFDMRPNGTINGFWPSLLLSTGGNFLYYVFGTRITSTVVAVADQWYHVVLERPNESDITTMYVDGVVQGTWADTTTYVAAGDGRLRIGGQGDSVNNPCKGWIDSVRFSNGRALYNNVEMPDHIFDPDVDDADLLLNMETKATSPYTTDDANAYSVTFNGAAALVSTERARGTTCLDCTGANTDYIDLPHSIPFGTGDFTIEFMYRYTAGGPTYQGIFEQRVGGSNSIYIGLTSVEQITAYLNGAPRIVGPVLNLNQWYHIVLERVDGVTRLFVDGLRVGADYVDTNNYVSTRTRLGSDETLTAGSFCYLDAVRATIGNAIYQKKFLSVPTMPFGEPLIAPPRIYPSVVATGGTETTVTIDGLEYKVHTFTAESPHGKFIVTQGGDVEYLIVGGGGGGGGNNTGGGGGGGEVVRGFYPVTPGPAYTVVVGAGGAGAPGTGSPEPGYGRNGGESSVFGIPAAGGGGGAGAGFAEYTVKAGKDGGSGGGGAGAGTGGSGSPAVVRGGAPIAIYGDGNYGGYGFETLTTTQRSGGGGGGAGSSGSNATGSGGNGGDPLVIAFARPTGSPIEEYGAGGGGADNSGTAGAGGGVTGGIGGEATNQPGNGVDGTGAGGGGLAETGSFPAGAGGSGVVIIRYPT